MIMIRLNIWLEAAKFLIQKGIYSYWRIYLHLIYKQVLLILYKLKKSSMTNISDTFSESFLSRLSL